MSRTANLLDSMRPDVGRIPGFCRRVEFGMTNLPRKTVCKVVRLGGYEINRKNIDSVDGRN
jgi:hypothetical protein